MSRLNAFRLIAYRLVFPRWSAAFQYRVLLCAVVGIVCGISGAWLVHLKNPIWIYVWHGAVFAVLACTWLYLKGTYLAYLDDAWNTYY